MAKKRTVLMVPFGAVAAVLCFTSAAWACGVLVGSITITGSKSGAPASTMTGQGGHFTGSSGTPTWSCLVNSGVPADCPNDVGPVVGGAEDPHAWVDVSTAAFGTHQLKASTDTYGHCPNVGITGIRCDLGDENVPPPAGVQNDVGDYWVNLVQAQWVNANGSSAFDGGSERISGNLSSGCGNGGDQTSRVVHLGLATINSSGAISAASSPMFDPNRAYADDATVPAPREIGASPSGVWRFYLPATNLTPTTPLQGTTPPLVANSVCVVDRYGTNSIEAPIQLFTV